MFQQSDLEQMQANGIAPERVEAQVDMFKRGVDYMALERPCTIGDGLLRVAPEEQANLLSGFDEAQDKGRASKFVPASGAASRMFKSLYQALETSRSGGDPSDQPDFAVFCRNLDQFAFAPELSHALSDAYGSLEKAAAEERYEPILSALLEDSGLGYGSKPKGVLAFHRHEGQVRTPVHEHLDEAKAYIAGADGAAGVHFTVSPEHQALFESVVSAALAHIEGTFKVSYSVQKKSTDTVAVTPDNQLFRNSDGSMLFRPGGHGALIENLNDLKGDIIFIKNIDNVTPPRLHPQTILWKKLLGGVLLDVQAKLFDYQGQLERGRLSDDDLRDMTAFMQMSLGHIPAEGWQADAVGYLKRIFNRPLRACGMVANQGEPGGGPFWVRAKDGHLSLQIVEGSQIDKKDAGQCAILANSTHFNPVDLVCAVRDQHGKPYDLTQFTDPEACFISSKSKDGRSLKALELPGLWNGAMSNWNTVFVEVPLITFNPVKTVLDLLRPEHR